MATLDERIAGYIDDISYKLLPKEVVDYAKTLILHHLYTGYAGISEDETQIAASLALDDIRGEGKSTVLGRERKTSAPLAAFVNATLMHGVQQEDTYHGLHPGPHTIPAAIAIGEERRADGVSLLESIVAGYEVNLHVGEAFARYTSPNGWRGTTVYGVLGVAATSAKMLGLDSSKIVDALSHSINMAGGLMQCWLEGTPEWLYASGLAAQNGLLSALLAERGANGARSSFAGPKGFLKAFCGQVPDDAEELPDKMKKEFLTPKVTLKPYSVITSILPVIHNAVVLHESDSISWDEVKSVRIVAGPRVTRGPLAASILDSGPYTNKTQAYKSLPCAIGIALRFGTVLPHTVSNYRNQDVSKLAERVEVVTNDSYESFYNSVEIVTEDGSKYHIEGEEFPSLGTEKVRENLLRAASQYVGEEKAHAMIDVIDSLDRDTVESLSNCLS